MSPALLTPENLVKVISLYDEKYKGLLRDNYNVTRLIFMSFATVENVKEEKDEKEKRDERDEKDDVEDEDLVFYTLEDIEQWNEFEVIKEFDSITLSQCYVMASDLYSLITLLLVITELKPYMKSGEYFTTVIPNEQELNKFRRSAQSLIRSIDPSITLSTMNEKKITFTQFQNAFELVFPFILKPLGSLFDTLLFNPQHQQKNDEGILPVVGIEMIQTKLMSAATLAQLSSFMGSEHVHSKLVKLYVGSDAGFSMRSFENKVFKWSAPTILLVSGTIVEKVGHGSRRKSFDDVLPPIKTRTFTLIATKRKVTYGVYVDSPWKASSKETFGTAHCKLFQLAPVQDIFITSLLSTNYVYFCRTHPGGIGIGSLPPQNFAGQPSKYRPQNVSLTIEESFEFGAFRHLGPGGSFKPGLIQQGQEFEDRFSIDELEVWGCGNAEDLEEQKRQWEWEEREAQYRQRVNIKAFDEDKALLELAGLVGNQKGSGGSI